MIGKTRQKHAAEVVEEYDAAVGKARGILRRPLAAGKLWHSRRQPSPDLEPWIAHYWSIKWDLRGCAPQTVESLPHPNVHLIFEEAKPVVSGVQQRKFSRVLEGQSKVFGIKFQPGGFRPFFNAPVSTLAHLTVSAKNIFGKDMEKLATVLLSSRKEDQKIEATNAFFRARIPKPDKTADLARQLVNRVLQETEIKTVDDLAAKAGIGKRSLQRIFGEYVGASPKWVIRRYRLHELVERFNAGDSLDWPQVALELGYFDQAHLINDFKSIVGYSPAQYQRKLRASD
ncbi:MAG: helix-turn-helix domain-containing protein [Candidatus Acidiferrum sp.]